MSIVDDQINNTVPPVRDIFWNQEVEQFYSEDSTERAQRQLVGSTANIKYPWKTTINTPYKIIHPVLLMHIKCRKVSNSIIRRDYFSYGGKVGIIR